jgi:hypothetical protein
MPAATDTNAAYANKAALSRALRKNQIARGQKPTKPSGLFVIERAIPVAATNVETANDELYLLQFPDGNVRLLNLRITATDLDTDGSPALVFSIKTETTGGTEVTLISGSTIGQAGGSDDLDANTPLASLDVGGEYLIMDVSTGAATAAAGTLTVQATVFIDPVTTW